MTVLAIRTWPHPDLRVAAVPVTDFGPELHTLVSDMAETMYTNKGVGLAATQVGVPLRVLVMDCMEDNFVVLVNHVVEEVSPDSEVQEEGCLSFPGIFESVSRPTWAAGHAFNEKGTRFSFRYYGLEARCLLHEGEHLNGKVLVDNLNRTTRRLVEKKLRNRKR